MMSVRHFTTGATNAMGAAAYAAMMARATKASGVIVRVTPADFLTILARSEVPLIIVAQGGVFKKHHQYLTSYKGLAFYTRSTDAFELPRKAEVVVAEKIWIPD
jgi:hypothetical protein